MMIFMMLFWIVLIAALVVGIIFLIRYLAPGQIMGEKTKDEAMQIAKNRYAHGEISKEEFDQLKKDLT